MSEAGWSLEELGARVERALSVSDYQPATSGRVRAVPDRRTIRYYTTLGLVDRPELAGRTALYGPRHLRQLVAIKRLQGDGLSLEDVQQRLGGLDDRALAQVARVPSEALTPAPLVEGSLEGDAPAVATPAAPESTRRASFWRAAPAEPTAPVLEPAPLATSSPAAEAPTDAGGEVQGLSLDDEVTLVWGRERDLEPGDILAIRAAAAPLLDLLREKGLVRSPRRPAGSETRSLP